MSRSQKSRGSSEHVYSTTSGFSHYDHIADPLYHLLQNGMMFEWTLEYTQAMKKLKEALRVAESLKKQNYDQPIVVTVDTSPTGMA